MSGLNKSKLKEIISDPVVRTIMVSFLTIIVTLGIIFSIAWHYRARIFRVLATAYTSEVKPAASNSVYNPPASEDLISSLISPAIEPEVVPKIIAEDTVVGAVKLAQPAVVSIVVSKQVPTYSVSYDQNNGGDLFGGMFPGFFQTPTYKQNGTEKKQIGGGSGFLISSDGMIVTNRHVVADKDAAYEVLLNTGKKYTATVLARDSVLDVAIIKINVTGKPYLNLGDSSSLDVGQSVIAIGNALGEFKNTVSVGVISGLSRSVTAGDNSGKFERLNKVIQTDAAINPGNSGGPLLNLKGQVIGINVAVVQGSSNVGFALPINDVKSVITSVRNTGKIIRPYIGIRYVAITPELKAKNNLAVDYGILVQRGQGPSDLAVIPGSPADRAGILENDIILEIDGQKLDENKDFMFVIRGKKVGDTLRLKVLSNGTEKNVMVRLDAAPDGV